MTGYAAGIVAPHAAMPPAPEFANFRWHDAMTATFDTLEANS